MDMTDKQSKKMFQRSATTDAVNIEDTQDNTNHEDNGQKRIRKSVSMDTGQAQIIKKTLSGSIRRKRISKRRPEPEYGRDTETYEKIRERVLQERAVTNAIDALHERWRIVLNSYVKCVAMNDKRKDLKLRKLSVKRQFELIVIKN
ncbi:uncharacterized protein LOC132732287 [Ruditapes philippinarum]|uniref:uncharacterized protein LOC132732287 n=1 Tax=Ruditapes philippinarum TaxID=129788 RepID=UPI00295B5E31|nr:uncharacterized protein LOC132732287 [Ruditapes philippinarum]